MLATMKQCHVRARGDDVAREAATVKPLLALVAAISMVAGWCWLNWGETGWPVGSFWWDELALSGAAHAARVGLIPSVDFWSPFILPVYMKMFTEDWVGYRSAYVLECLLQAGVVVALFAVLIGFQRQSRSVYWVAGLMALSVMAPFNIGSIADSEPGTVVNACSYNRLGGAIIALVAMLPAVRRDGKRDLLLMFWLGAVFAISASLKVTVLQITWVLIALWAILSGERGWWRLLLGATIISLLILFPFGPVFDWGRGYFNALASVSEVRAYLLKQHAVHYVELTLGHRVELSLMVFVALLMVARSVLLGVPWVGVMVWYLAACAAILAFTLSNFGDNGLMPSLAAMWAVLQLQSGGEPSDLLLTRQMKRIVLLLRGVVVGLLLGFGVLYVAAIFYWVWSLNARHLSDGYVAAQASSPFLRSYVFKAGDWSARPDISGRGASLDYRDPAIYASYIEGVDQALMYLEGSVPDKANKVYALDFPSYIFSMAGGYGVSKNTYPWLLYGHEVTLDHHPDAELLFSDVDVLMVPRCSLSGGNRSLLKAIYRVPIEHGFERMASLQCWDVYRKMKVGG